MTILQHRYLATPESVERAKAIAATERAEADAQMLQRASDIRHIAKAIAEVVHRLPFDSVPWIDQEHCTIAALYALRTVELKGWVER